MTTRAEIEAQLAGAMGHKDETPNIELAKKIVTTGDTAALGALGRVLATGKIASQNDAIKVLYEIGALAPAMICDQMSVFLSGMVSKNNRLVWGSQTALHYMRV